MRMPPFSSLAVAAALAFPLSSLGAQTQEISGSDGLFATTDSTFSVSVNYDADDGDNTLSGLSFRIHYDSSMVSFEGFAETFAYGAQIANFDAVPRVDTDDFDGDPTTDSYLSVSLAEFGAAWPGSDVTLPAALATAKFAPAETFTEGSTTIRFSAVEAAPGRTFASTPAVLEVVEGLTLVTSNADFAAAGGSGSVEFTTADETIAWSASVAESWVTFPSPTSGTGAGSVSFVVAANDSINDREANISVNDKTFVVSQAGVVPTYSVTPASTEIGADGGTVSFTVESNAVDAPWTAVSPAEWAVLNAESGIGPATVSVELSPIETAAPRTVTLSIAGETVAIEQEGRTPVLTLDLATASFGEAGGNGDFTVSSNVTDVAWAAVSEAQWITVVSGSGTSTGDVAFSVAPNTVTVSARSGTIAVGDLEFVVTQAGGTASFTVSPLAAEMAPEGGSASFSVTPSIPDAPWEASSQTGWLSISLGASGTGAGTVTVSAAETESALLREGFITIAGKTISVTQEGGAYSTFVTPSTAQFDDEGGEGTAVISVTLDDAPWTATTGANWITIAEPASGSGSASLSFTVAANNSTDLRSGAITINERTLSVNQDGMLPLPVVSGPPSETVERGAPVSVQFTASDEGGDFAASGLPTGLSLDASSGLLTGTVDAAGDYPFTITASNESGTSAGFAFTLTVLEFFPEITSSAVWNADQDAASSYQIVATGNPTAFRATGLPAGFSIDGDTGLISGSTATAGSFEITVEAENSRGIATKTISLLVNEVGEAPTVISASADLIILGEEALIELAANNSPTNFSVSGLPAGLSLDSATGVISGVPTELGDFTVVVTASNAVGSTTASLDLSIVRPAPEFSGAELPVGYVNFEYSFALEASNEPTAYAATGLPAGLTISASTGEISGTPSQAGDFEVSFTASNAGGETTIDLGLTINPEVFAPEIDAPATASATAGKPFTLVLPISNAPTSVEVNGLPPGLTFSFATRTISGVPQSAGSSTITLQGSNVLLTGAEVSIALTVAPPAPVVTSAKTATATEGSAFSYQISTAPAATSFAAVGLPAGLSIDDGTGAISGTPSESGTFTVSLSATNSGGTGTLDLRLEVVPLVPPPPPPAITSSALVSGRVDAAFNFQLTATPLATSFSSTELPPGLSLNATTGAIAGTPSRSGTYAAVVTATGEGGAGAPQVLILKIQPKVSVPTVTNATSATGQVGKTFSLALTATNSPTGFEVSSLPAGLSYDAGSASIVGTPTAPGTTAISVAGSNSAGTGPAKTITVEIFAAPESPQLTGAAVVDGRVGQPLSFTFTASPAATLFVAEGLPAGLTLDGATGEVSGIPLASGSSSVAVVASANGVESAPASVVFNIARPLLAPVVAGDIELNATVGIGFSYQVVVANSPTTIGADNLPPGLEIDAASGLISGVPTTVGSFAVEITAENADGQSEPAMIDIVVQAPASAPEIQSALTASGRVGVAFQYQIVANGAPLTAFQAAGLPAGLSLNPSTGRISGTPSAPGTATVQIAAANAAGLGEDAALVLTIAPAASAPVVTSEAFASGQQGAAFSYMIEASNSPTGFDAEGLPEGVEVDSLTGEIAGTPVAPGLYEAEVFASNATGVSDAQPLTILIEAAASVPRMTSSSTYASLTDTPISIQLSATELAETSPLPPDQAFGARGLPSGLNLNTATGVISGTIRVAGDYTATVWARNATGKSAEQNVALSVRRGANYPRMTGPGNVLMQLGAETRLELETSGSPTHFEILVDPAFYGVVNGGSTEARYALTPARTGETVVRARAGKFDSAAGVWLWSRYSDIAVTVQAPPDTPLITSSTTLEGQVGESFTYALSASPEALEYDARIFPYVPEGLTWNENNELVGTPDEPGTFEIFVQARNADGWGPVSVADLEILPVVGSPVIGEGGAEPSQTGNDDSVLKARMAGAFASQTMFRDAALRMQKAALAARAEAPSLTLNAQVGVSFAYTLSASPAPDYYRFSDLPRGLSANSVAGRISGVPQQAGDYPVLVTPYNAVGEGATVRFLIKVAAGAGAPEISSATSGSVNAGEEWNYTAEASGSPTSFNVYDLPDFLAFAASAGTLSGSTEEPGVYVFELSANNLSGEGDRVTITLTVTPQASAPVVSAPGTLSAAARANFSHDFTSDTPTANFAARNLPAGMALQTVTVEGAKVGRLSGAPLAQGTYRFDVWASNGELVGGAVPVTLEVSPAAGTPVVSEPLYFYNSPDAPLSVQFAATGSPSSFNLVGKPTGATFDGANGTLAGSPEPGVYTVTVSANNASGQGAPQEVEIYYDVAEFSLASQTASYASEGGSGSVSFTGTRGAPWTAETAVSWIAMGSPAPNGTGDGSFTYSVSANNSVNGRLGTIVVGGREYEVSQSGMAASYAIDLDTFNFLAEGGTNALEISATPGDAPWSVDGLPNWISVTQGTSGTGTATITLQASANTQGIGRSASFTVAGFPVSASQAAGGVDAIWADAKTSSPGRYESAWFGGFQLYADTSWYYHDEHGWIYPFVISQDRTYWYMTDYGWTFTTQSIYPWFYSFGIADWAYYLEGTGPLGTRWFYDLSVDDWVGTPRSGEQNR